MFDFIFETLGLEAIILRRAALLEIIIWVVMLAAVMIDMRTGIRKAKALHQPIDSHGLRRTFTKFGDYGKVAALFMCIDILGILFDIYTMPYASGAAGVIAVGIEAWSVRENLRAARSAAAKIPELMEKLVVSKDKKEIAGILREFNEIISAIKSNKQE